MWGAGGMMGPVDKIGYTVDGADMVPLTGGWEYKKEPTELTMAPLIPWQTMTGYTGMHNAMIAPLEGLQFKGAVWYQGESNTRRDAEYDEMLAAMIANWRRMFGKGHASRYCAASGFWAKSRRSPKSRHGLTYAKLRRITAVRDENIGLYRNYGSW